MSDPGGGPATGDPHRSTDREVVVVGIGAEGWAGLTERARAAVEDAEVLIGAARQLALVPAAVLATRLEWPSPLRPAVRRLVADHADRRLVVLASGDPLWHGVGRTLVEEVGAERVSVLPHVSSVQLACAAMRWSVEHVEVVSLVASPVEAVLASAHDSARLVVLSRGALTPGAVAETLRENGFADSTLTVLSALGGGGGRFRARAADWPEPDGPGPAPLDIDPLNVVAVECVADEGTVRRGLVPGLPDEAYLHDGQLTKREVRAVALAALAPAPGELLWDVGGGAGSIAIEWLRAHPHTRAVCVERVPERATRISANAARLGVPRLRVALGSAPEVLHGLDAPNAVFIGGGLTVDGVVKTCWEALRPGGRLVVNAVTLESEAEVFRWRTELGGDLVRVEVSRAGAVGGFTAWRPALPVTQWSVAKPAEPRADEEGLGS